jgi:two-component system phosphate regulon sensor histidine kinase PhoR
MQNSLESNADPLGQDAVQFAKTLLNSIADPVLVFDREWKLRHFNPAAAKLFQLRDSSSDKPLDEVVQSGELVAFARRGLVLAEWVPAANGAANPEFVALIPRLERIRSAAGDDNGYILLLRDISQLRKLNRNQSEFVRIVSHDLRSPLTSMQGFASMLESGTVGELDERQKQFIEKILSGIGQITGLVDNIQDAGRFDPETGFYEMQRSACDIGDIVMRIVRSHLIPAEKQELKVTVSVADDVPIIHADSNMLERAISNLVDNAIKYTPNGGKVDVSVRRTQQGLEVAVRDTGLGITPENQQQLFQRHVRIARKEHRKIKGTGLGLFIVRSVAKQHGGRAWVESAEGQGSTFILSIPLDAVSQPVATSSD